MSKLPLFSALALGLVAAVARAAPVVDQSFTTASPGINAAIGSVTGLFDLKVFQTFTVGVTGELDRVDFLLERRGTHSTSLVVDIVRANDLLGAALASVTAPSSQVSTTAAFAAFDFSAANLAVTAGDELAIRLSSAVDYTSGHDSYVALGAPTGGYAAGLGRHWRSDVGFMANPLDYDFSFRTYVEARSTVAEPPGLALLALALAAAALKRRRHPAG